MHSTAASQRCEAVEAHALAVCRTDAGRGRLEVVALQRRRGEYSAGGPVPSVARERATAEGALTAALYAAYVGVL